MTWGQGALKGVDFIHISRRFNRDRGGRHITVDLSGLNRIDAKGSITCAREGGLFVEEFH